MGRIPIHWLDNYFKWFEHIPPYGSGEKISAQTAVEGACIRFRMLREFCASMSTKVMDGIRKWLGCQKLICTQLNEYPGDTECGVLNKPTAAGRGEEELGEEEGEDVSQLTQMQTRNQTRKKGRGRGRGARDGGV